MTIKPDGADDDVLTEEVARGLNEIEDAQENSLQSLKSYGLWDRRFWLSTAFKIPIRNAYDEILVKIGLLWLFVILVLVLSLVRDLIISQL